LEYCFCVEECGDNQKPLHEMLVELIMSSSWLGFTDQKCLTLVVVGIASIVTGKQLIYLC
jgi:hypothetical protein